ncbi:Uncharacterised protein [Bordetella pertussis]|nr:Uncharacterised protein [Bordetella pertussis]
MGWVWVITTRPLASPLEIRLPWSTWRRPSRPAMGAVMREKSSCSRALSTAARSLLMVPSYWRTSAACVSSCWRAIESCL